LIKTHIVNVPEIYGTDKELMQPSEYATKLPGAIVQCYIKVAHWDIREKAVFTPRLKQMFVLRSPSTVALEKEKRKRLGADYPGSPT
jgi:hypothetical protein